MSFRYPVVLATACCSLALTGSARGAPQPQRFEVAAWVDHFDFAKFFDGEKSEGIAAILDHVEETGATTILWRNCSGSMMRYQSRIDPDHGNARLDKRRTPDARPAYGWLRYGRAEPDILRTVVRECRERGMRPGVHWPFEENHWGVWTIGSYILEHPQYWGRHADGSPTWRRVSLGYDEVMDYKLLLFKELIDRGVETVMLDFWREGGWGPHMEYTEPNIRAFRERYGEDPPDDAADPRWVQLVCDRVTELLRRMRTYARQRNPSFTLMAGVPAIAPVSEQPKVRHGADWQRWVEEGIIDTLVVSSVHWDRDRPFASTRELYREVLDIVDGRCKVLLPVMQYGYQPYGLPNYQEHADVTQAEAAERLTRMAWELGAGGISLEVVDYNNYGEATRQVLRTLTQTDCRSVKEVQP